MTSKITPLSQDPSAVAGVLSSLAPTTGPKDVKQNEWVVGFFRCVREVYPKVKPLPFYITRMGNGTVTFHMHRTGQHITFNWKDKTPSQAFALLLLSIE